MAAGSRAPSDNWLSPHWQAEMAKIDQCVDCGACMTRCPYELNIPQLLRKNWADYQDILIFSGLGWLPGADFSPENL